MEEVFLEKLRSMSEDELIQQLEDAAPSGLAGVVGGLQVFKDHFQSPLVVVESDS